MYACQAATGSLYFSEEENKSSYGCFLNQLSISTPANVFPGDVDRVTACLFTQSTEYQENGHKLQVYSMPLRSRNQVMTLFLSKHYFRNLKLKKTWIPALALTDGSPSRRDYSPFLPLARLWQTLSGHPIGINGSPSASFSNGIVTGKALVGYDDAFFLSFS